MRNLFSDFYNLWSFIKSSSSEESSFSSFLKSLDIAIKKCKLEYYNWRYAPQKENGIYFVEYYYNYNKYRIPISMKEKGPKKVYYEIDSDELTSEKLTSYLGPNKDFNAIDVNSKFFKDFLDLHHNSEKRD
jgi:hypothetical protein